MGLGLVGGLVDAYTYLFHGQTFASVQSGNIIMLGIHLAKGELKPVFGYVIPVLVFFIGIMTAEFIHLRFNAAHKFQWQSILLTIEIIGIFVMGIYARQLPNLTVNTILSFCGAMQLQGFRKLKGIPFATTMTTGNVRSGATFLAQSIAGGHPGALRKSADTLLVAFSFGFGAFSSGLLTQYVHSYILWVAVLVLILILIFIQPRKHQ